MSRNFTRKKILDAKGENGIGTSFFVRDYRNIVVKFWTASSANMTVKCQWAVLSATATESPQASDPGNAAPNFASAQSVANHWDYIEMADYQDSSNPITWDTWIVLSGTDDFRILEINTNALDWINFIVSWWAAWTVTVEVIATE